MTYLASDIITQFELQVSDMTELSTSEELIILNRVRRKINRRPWEANRKFATLYQSTTSTSVPLPSDFYTFANNGNYNDSSYYNEPGFIYVGGVNARIAIIPYADRQQYRNSPGHAYVDQGTNSLVFAQQPGAANVIHFDYYAMPADLAIGDYDWMTNLFPEALVYGMATEDFILQLSDKAKSYAPENAAKFKDEMGEIASWNMQSLGNLM